jgi:hypothetical protein
MSDIEVVARLVDLDVCETQQGLLIMKFLRSTTTTRSAVGSHTYAHLRTLIRRALLNCAPRCEDLLRELDEATPLFHPGYVDEVLIPARMLDATHSCIPRPTNPFRNRRFYNANPRKRGFQWKVPVVVRIYDGAVLDIPPPAPGSVHDIKLAPRTWRRRPPYLCDTAYIGAPYRTVVGKKRARGQLQLSRGWLRYNAALSRWRGLAECVNGRLKSSYPRLRFWGGRDWDGRVLHAAWLFAACAHNVYIARSPMVLPGRDWDWLLTGELASSDPWDGGVPLVVGSGGYWGPPPTPANPRRR